MRAERAYYYCPGCRSGHCPWEQALGLRDGELTPAACELTSLAGLLSSFEEARAKVLPMLAGLRLCASTVQRTTEAVGAELGRRLAAGEVFGPEAAWDWQPDERGKRVAYVSADATGVGQQGPGGTAAEGRMASVGMIFNPRVPGRGGGQATYLAGLYGLDELGAQLRRQGARVGMDGADEWVALTDGGSGLEEFMRTQFPRAVCILDFFHAAEHVNELAKAWYKDEEEAAAQARQWCHRLKHEGGPALSAEWEQLDLRGKSGSTREVHRQVTQYFRNHGHKMDYPSYRANGWLIGSGHVESACKAVVGARLKGTGMRWGEDGADAVCHLRALFKSEPGTWASFWASHPN